jgi:hypothetical protein
MLLAEGWESTSLNPEIGRVAKDLLAKKDLVAQVWTFRPGIRMSNVDPSPRVLETHLSKRRDMGHPIISGRVNPGHPPAD